MPPKKKKSSQPRVSRQSIPAKPVIKASAPKSKVNFSSAVSSEILLPEISRIIIENVRPEIDGGTVAIKRVVEEEVRVSADIFVDGAGVVGAVVLYRPKNETAWREAMMRHIENDRWEGSFQINRFEDYVYTVQAWHDSFTAWKQKLMNVSASGRDKAPDFFSGQQWLLAAAEKAPARVASTLRKWASDFSDKKKESANYEIVVGGALEVLMSEYGVRRWATAYHKELQIQVDQKKALFSAWYEFFPRSCGQAKKHGTFKDAAVFLPEIARMGFDVVCLPPVQPSGNSPKKATNKEKSENVSNPWVIGSKAGGHKSVHPELGTIADFKLFASTAEKLGLDVALEISLQCAQDHPYIKDHPDWFAAYTDGSLKGSDNFTNSDAGIFLFDFDSVDRKNLWAELKSIFLFWVDHGVRVFCIDSPQNIPFRFWDWLIREVRRDCREVLFLSKAFARPKVMARLAKSGFQQSQTYFAWRTSAQDLASYLKELTQTEIREYSRPVFWPNTPEILPWYLQKGGRPAFMARLVLAATLSSCYGIYGPAFELCAAEAVPGKEEYLDSEKEHLKVWNREVPWSLRDFIMRVNKIRRENRALQSTGNVKFLSVNNGNLLCYCKATPDLSNILLIVVNLDPFSTQSGWVQVPVWELGLDLHGTYKVHDLLSNDWYTWYGEYNYVELNPSSCPAHVLKVEKIFKTVAG